MNEAFHKKARVSAGFLLFFCLLISKADAQSYGIKGGLCINNIEGQPTANVRPGAQIGAFVKLGGEEVLYFKSEFLLTHKGSLQWNINAPNNVGLYYADLNVMFGIEIIDGLALNLGFQPSLLLYGHADFSGLEDGSNEGSITSDLTTMDYSTLIGAEYFFSEFMFVGMRYNHGWVPIQGRKGELPLSGRNPMNRTFQIYLGYRLNK